MRRNRLNLAMIEPQGQRRACALAAGKPPSILKPANRL
jgi:hypothetical protein